MSFDPIAWALANRTPLVELQTKFPGILEEDSVVIELTQAESAMLEMAYKRKFPAILSFTIYFYDFEEQHLMVETVKTHHSLEGSLVKGYAVTYNGIQYAFANIEGSGGWVCEASVAT